MNPHPKPPPKNRSHAVVSRKEWREVREQHLKAHRRCEGPQRGLRGLCGGGLQVHHVMPRSAGGSKEHGPLLTVCADHHAWIEQHRTEAKALGLLIRRTATKVVPRPYG